MEGRKQDTKSCDLLNDRFDQKFSSLTFNKLLERKEESHGKFTV